MFHMFSPLMPHKPLLFPHLAVAPLFTLELLLFPHLAAAPLYTLEPLDANRQWLITFTMLEDCWSCCPNKEKEEEEDEGGQRRRGKQPTRRWGPTCGIEQRLVMMNG